MRAIGELPRRRELTELLSQRVTSCRRTSSSAGDFTCVCHPARPRRHACEYEVVLCASPLFMPLFGMYKLLPMNQPIPEQLFESPRRARSKKQPGTRRLM